MKILKNVFSQWYRYVLWALISVFFWGWIFTLLTDAPAAKKLVLCVDRPALQDEALEAVLSEQKPEGIKLVAVHPFDYYIFDTEELRCADLYIVGEREAERYIESFLPLSDSGFSAEGRALWTHEGVAYGLRIYDAETGGGAASDYIEYTSEGETPQSYYLFFGVQSAHREDGAAAALAETLFGIS